MSDTEILTYNQWVDTIFGEGSKDGYITYVKEKEKEREKKKERFNKMSEEEKEREEKRERFNKMSNVRKEQENQINNKGTDIVDNLSDREVQEQLLILTSKNFKKLNIISNISIFFLVITIISIVYSLVLWRIIS